MAFFEYGWSVALSGVIVGLVLGFVARAYHFCTLAALERHWYAGDSTGIRSWALAAAVATGATALLQALGLIDISTSFYLTEPVPVLGAIVGGLMFGVGMALVGTCGFGAIVRFGGGNLRALVVLTGMGLAAIAAQRGLTGHVRQWFVQPFDLDMGTLGGDAPGALISHATSPGIATATGLAVALIIAVWCLRDAAFRADRGKIVAGLVVGLCVAAGWLVTSTAAQVGFVPFQVEAGSFVAPVGDTILQIVTVTGQLPDYGVGLMVGVFGGAAIAAWRSDDVRWEACDDARELSRHLAGAFLMGTGGVFALGCTIGQGVTAVSALSITAPLALASMVIGARFGLAFLLEGAPFAFLRHGKSTDRHPAE